MSDKQIGETSEVISTLEKSEKTCKNARERKELERQEKRKELEKYINSFFEGVSETSTLKSLNNLTSDQRFETLTYNFDELRRREFLSFVLSYGMFFENPEIFWIS
jgi:ERCC4-type nuclease